MRILLDSLLIWYRYFLWKFRKHFSLQLQVYKEAYHLQIEPILEYQSTPTCFDYSP
jgi:hypothetical protein